MDRQPLRLAALAAAAVPGLAPVSVEASPDDPADFSTAVVVDGEGQRYRTEPTYLEVAPDTEIVL